MKPSVTTHIITPFSIDNIAQAPYNSYGDNQICSVSTTPVFEWAFGYVV